MKLFLINICFNHFSVLFIALQTKLSEEKSARQKADFLTQEKERQISMLSVDYRQIQQRLQKLEGEHRQEVEKVSNCTGIFNKYIWFLNTPVYCFRVRLYMLKLNKSYRKNLPYNLNLVYIYLKLRNCVLEKYSYRVKSRYLEKINGLLKKNYIG